MSPSLLVGNSFAILVGALELARQGKPVTVLTDGKPLGGYFVGMSLEGFDFDAGMVVLERHVYPREAPDLQTYDASVRYDWARFGGLVDRWLGENIGMRRIPTVQCLVKGRQVPDYLISDRLEAFVGLDLRPPEVISRQDEYHPTHKIHSHVYDALSYAEAAQANHGEAIHLQFIEPFVRKLMGVSSEGFLARYHRAAWAPLYFPETLASAMRGESHALAETPYWVPPAGSVSRSVRDLHDLLAHMPNVNLVNEAVVSLKNEAGDWTAMLDGGARYSGGQLALGLAPDRARHLFGGKTSPHGAATTVTILFALVRADVIRYSYGGLMVVDEAYASYRLTDQDAMAGLSPEFHRVTIEASPEYLHRLHPGVTDEVALRNELMEIMEIEDDDAVRVLKCMVVKNVLVLPTVELIADMRTAHAELAELTPGAILTSHLLGYGAASLNEQIVQGLTIAETFS
ncbi:MAG TPA: hypothetical protein VK149_09025 [Sideroxyarcus sp.]|nr:hypothetical protein [Sideroxyarcus sp.]